MSKILKFVGEHYIGPINGNFQKCVHDDVLEMTDDDARRLLTDFPLEWKESSKAEMESAAKTRQHRVAAVQSQTVKRETQAEAKRAALQAELSSGGADEDEDG